MIIIGIDVGRSSGGIAEFKGPILEYLIPMPSIDVFADLMEAAGRSAHVFIEKAQSFPKQGIASTFAYGDHFGQLQGVLTALKIPFTLVAPKTWTKVMHAGATGNTPKDKSVQVARRLYPGLELKPEDSRGKKPHLGMTDALMLASYGRRILK